MWFLQSYFAITSSTASNMKHLKFEEHLSVEQDKKGHFQRRRCHTQTKQKQTLWFVQGKSSPRQKICRQTRGLWKTCSFKRLKSHSSLYNNRPLPKIMESWPTPDKKKRKKRETTGSTSPTTFRGINYF